VDEVRAAVADPAAGGIALFAGAVRDNDHDHQVRGLSYTAHPSAEAELRLVAAELPAWVNDYPLRERLRALLMQALCECGCRADALHLYRTGRETIVAEIGLEPGLELQRLHHWILTGEGVGNPARARTGARMLALTSPADPG